MFVEATMRTKKRPLLRRRRRRRRQGDKRRRFFSLLYDALLFVVVFSSSLFFFVFDESNERTRRAFFAGEDDDDGATTKTMMISFVSFPRVVLVEAADAAQEAEKRSTSGSAATISEGTNSIVNFHRHHREVRKRLRERKTMMRKQKR